ncbi:MipA/OmpV family protein [Aureimonas psammosilenae]|uniref:MipA/OmpV family protein n=1 Tax=Aureimonas psammosilenae TaxID=2495496 RepID=UPI001260F6B4|nr:MipA/OmpV family protein [Aureimonas psammosilenae]
MTKAALGFCLLSLFLAGHARAADVYEEAASARPTTTDLVIELGVGGRMMPEYAGAKDYQFSPYPIVSVDYLSLPGLFTFGSIDPQRGGFSIGPSFEFIDKRNAADYDELQGLRDVDATYEAGVKLGYEWDFAEVYGEFRYAFGGADGFVGDVGANLVARPSQEWQLKAGPTLSFASGKYMNALFGVSDSESIATGGRLDAYDADGGFKSAGVAASARYEFRPTWFLNADASWNRFIGDAEDSPIVKTGDENQYTVGLGISKRFSLDLF